MDEIELHEKLDEIETYLQKHATRPERPFWLVEDTGEDYCFDCIKAMFDTLEYGENYDGGGSIARATIRDDVKNVARFYSTA